LTSREPGLTLASRDRFTVHIRDKERYPAAMTAALGELLGSL